MNNGIQLLKDMDTSAIWLGRYVNGQCVTLEPVNVTAKQEREESLIEQERRTR